MTPNGSVPQPSFPWGIHKSTAPPLPPPPGLEVTSREQHSPRRPGGRDSRAKAAKWEVWALGDQTGQPSTAGTPHLPSPPPGLWTLPPQPLAQPLFQGPSSGSWSLATRSIVVCCTFSAFSCLSLAEVSCVSFDHDLSPTDHKATQTGPLPVLFTSSLSPHSCLLSEWVNDIKQALQTAAWGTLGG